MKQSVIKSGTNVNFIYMHLIDTINVQLEIKLNPYSIYPE